MEADLDQLKKLCLSNKIEQWLASMLTPEEVFLAKW